MKGGNKIVLEYVICKIIIMYIFNVNNYYLR